MLEKLEDHVKELDHGIYEIEKMFGHELQAALVLLVLMDAYNAKIQKEQLPRIDDPPARKRATVIRKVSMQKKDLTKKIEEVIRYFKTNSTIKNIATGEEADRIYNLPIMKQIRSILKPNQYSSTSWLNDRLSTLKDKERLGHIKADDDITEIASEDELVFSLTIKGITLDETIRHLGELLEMQLVRYYPPNNMPLQDVKLFGGFIVMLHLISGIKSRPHTDIKLKILKMAYLAKLSGMELLASSNVIRALQKENPNVLNIHVYAYEDRLAYPFPFVKVLHPTPGGKRYTTCTKLGGEVLEKIRIFGRISMKPRMSCPNCKEKLQFGWKWCPRCDYDQEISWDNTKCHKCGEELKPEWTRCPICGTPPLK